MDVDILYKLVVGKDTRHIYPNGFWIFGLNHRKDSDYFLMFYISTLPIQCISTNYAFPNCM